MTRGFWRMSDDGNAPRNPPARNDDAIIEMDNLGAQAANPGTPPGTPPPRPEIATPPFIFGKNGLWFAGLITLAVLFTAIGLYAPYSDFDPKGRAEWTRESSDEMLTHRQVLFTAVPKQYIWAKSLWSVALQVLIVEAVYRYAGWVASTNGTKGQVIAWFRNLFFAVAVFLVALLSWGWSMWSF
jgi:hypothetical protein